MPTSPTITGVLYDNGGAVINVQHPDYGATGDGTTDDTLAIRAAITAAQAAGKHAVFVPAGDYRCDVGAITVPQGITLHGVPSSGEYDGNVYTHGARFIRTAGGPANEPLIQLSTSSQCLGIECRWEKAGGALRGIIRFGEVGTFITYATFKGAIRGTRSGDIDGTTTCYGILFPESSDARYFNTIDAYVTECDVSIKLGNNANANRVVLMSREAHLHCDLNAASGAVIENDITLRMFAIAALSPAWGLRQHNSSRNRIRGIYEAYGSCFYADDSTSADDVQVITNEASPSYVPLTSRDLRTAAPINRDQYASLLLPNRTTGDREIFGRGNRVRLFKEVSGTLPWMNRPAGTLAAADGNCRRIIQFGSAFTKSSNVSVWGTLRIYAYAPFNLGENVTEVEFLYRNTNQTTGAGQLCVLRAVQKGSVITGLHFLSGVAGPKAFSIALVGGGAATNTSFDRIACSLEYDAITYSTNVVDMSTLAEVTFASTVLDSNDVSNGVSMLTVADTVV